jgi:hypothetical protein
MACRAGILRGLGFCYLRPWGRGCYTPGVVAIVGAAGPRLRAETDVWGQSCHSEAASPPLTF